MGVSNRRSAVALAVAASVLLAACSSSAKSVGASGSTPPPRPQMGVARSRLVWPCLLSRLTTGSASRITKGCRRLPRSTP